MKKTYIFDDVELGFLRTAETANDEDADYSADACNLDEEFGRYQALIRRTLARDHGKLTDSANGIFADQLHDMLERASTMGMKVDFGQFAAAFFPVISMAPEGTPLNKLAMGFTLNFNDAESEWEVKPSDEIAADLYRAFAPDENTPSTTMPMPLANKLCGSYIHHLDDALRSGNFYASLMSLNDDNGESKTDKLEALTPLLEAADNTGVILGAYTWAPARTKVLQRLQRVAAEQYDKGEAEILGIQEPSVTDPVRPATTAATAKPAPGLGSSGSTAEGTVH